MREAKQNLIKRINWGSPIVSNVIAVLVPCIFLGISLCRDCRQDSKIDTLNYEMNALKFKPVLKVIGEPSIEAVEGRLDTLELEQDTVAVAVNLTIISRLRFVNVGSSLAKVFLVGITDTLSGSIPIARNILLDTRNREKRVERASLQEYFGFPEVLPSDTTDLAFEHTVDFVTETEEFTLHYFVLYEGPIGAFYDTYCWARYEHRSEPFMIDWGAAQLQMVGDKRYVSWSGRLNMKNLLDSVRYRGSAQKYYTYRLEEARGIRDFLKEKERN